ncbi:DUF7701 domain-containing protein [Promicromonospora sukumoe]
MTYLTELANEIRANLPKGVAAPDQHPDLFLVYAVLLTSKGVSVTNEDVHDAWVAWMLMRGEKHRSMVPFSHLSTSVQAEDTPFTSAIRDVARRMPKY